MMRIRTEVREGLEGGMTSVPPEGRDVRRFQEPEAVPRHTGLMVTDVPVSQESVHSLTAFKALVFTTSHATELAL